MKGTKTMWQFRWQMRSSFWLNECHPLLLTHKCHQICSPFYFGSGFNIDLFLGTLAAQVLVMYYQGDCSSGQLSLIGFRLLVVLPPLEWKRMSDPVMVSLWCSWINMGFGVQGPGFRKVYTLPLIICVTLGKSPNLLKPVLSVKNFKKGIIIPHITCHNESE